MSFLPSLSTRRSADSQARHGFAKLALQFQQLFAISFFVGRILEFDSQIRNDFFGINFPIALLGVVTTFQWDAVREWQRETLSKPFNQLAVRGWQ